MWQEWKESLNNRKFRIYFLLGVVGLAMFALYLPYFFNYILLNKPGIQLQDPVLLLFTPRDWSIEIFVALYFCTLLSLAFNFRKPKTFLLGIQIYVVVNFTRMVTLYLFTLDAPEGIIPLNDPFLTHIAYGQPVYVKDLFFSGHISTLFLLFLVERKRLLKWAFLVCTFVVAVLLAWQRVHYTLDLVAAPVITWIVFRFFRWFNATQIP